MGQLQDKQAQTIDRLEKYRKYQATITLNGVESFAHNLMVKAKLMELGFTNVTVEGTGCTRIATGVWSRDAQSIINLTSSRVSEIKAL